MLPRLYNFGCRCSGKYGNIRMELQERGSMAVIAELVADRYRIDHRTHFICAPITDIFMRAFSDGLASSCQVIDFADAAYCAWLAMPLSAKPTRKFRLRSS